MDDITKITEALSSLSPEKKQIVIDMINALGADIRIEPIAILESQPDCSNSMPKCEGMHALLKLGVAKGVHGIPISPLETLQCLDRMVKESEMVCLGTNSQAVSTKYRTILKRLYILVDNRVQRVVEIETVLDEVDFNKLRASREVTVCPDRMEHARTWFLIKRVWIVTESPEPDDIQILTTGKSIAGAISAGQATFFYVQPINNLTAELVGDKD